MHTKSFFISGVHTAAGIRMADDERQSTPYMGCFDLDGVETNQKDQLLAGIKGNENAGGDKAYKKVVAGHGAQITGTVYAMTFETALRAHAFLRCAELKLSPEEFVDFLEQLSQGADVKALAMMVLENRTDFSGKSLVNPALAGDVATTGEALPGRWASIRDPTGSLKQKRAELLAQQKKEADWAKKEKQMRALGFLSDEEIEAKKKEYLAKDPAAETFDGNLDDTGEETETTGKEKVAGAATDAVAQGVGTAIGKGFSKLLG